MCISCVFISLLTTQSVFVSYPIHLIHIAIESFDDDDEAEAADKEEYLTDLEEIKEEGKSIADFDIELSTFVYIHLSHIGLSYHPLSPSTTGKGNE